MVDVSWALGGFLARSMAGGSLLRAGTIGACVAVATLQLGIVLGCLPQLLGSRGIERYGFDVAVRSFLVKPLYWINLFGLAPAVLLGVIFEAAVGGTPPSDEP